MKNILSAICSSIIIIKILNFESALSLKSKVIKYANVVEPPGFYKIIVFDVMKRQISADCADIFDFVYREINKKVVRIKLFKNVPNSDLEEFENCFEHFYTTFTDEEGKFKLDLADDWAETIFIHALPLNNQKALIRSFEEPNIFAQNVLQKIGWKSTHFSLPFQFHFGDKETKIGKLLRNWLQNRRNDSSNIGTGVFFKGQSFKIHKLHDEIAFFIKAYFLQITTKAVAMFTHGRKLKMGDLALFDRFGAELRECQRMGGDEVLEQKLAQIDGMQKMVQNFCQFLLTEDLPKAEKGLWPQKALKTHPNMVLWNPFCEQLLWINGSDQSLLERLHIAKLITVDDQNAKTNNNIQTYGTGAFIQPLSTDQTLENVDQNAKTKKHKIQRDEPSSIDQKSMLESLSIGKFPNDAVAQKALHYGGQSRAGMGLQQLAKLDADAVKQNAKTTMYKIQTGGTGVFMARFETDHHSLPVDPIF